MNVGEYHLHVDEDIPRVTFNTESMKGAKAGLADLKRCRKQVALRRRLEFASLRENRTRLGTARRLSSKGGAIGGVLGLFAQSKIQAETDTDNFDIARLDRILVAMDHAILEIETQIAAFKAK